jgi:hypothetical protein
MDLTCCEVRMRDTTRAERLLSLFTSPDCAAAIAGDLTEERRDRGSIWFWLHVFGTTLALWRSAFTDAPLIVLMLAVAGCTLLAGPRIRRRCGGQSVSSLERFTSELARAVVLLVGWSALDWRLAGEYRAETRHGGVRDACSCRRGAANRVRCDGAVA